LCSLFRRNACTKTKDTCTDHNWQERSEIWLCIWE
jgi:hypothetical protein